MHDFLVNLNRSARIYMNPSDLFTFTTKILNGKLHFLCNVSLKARL